MKKIIIPLILVTISVLIAGYTLLDRLILWLHEYELPRSY